MSISYAIILGFLQGITEFLPVSSSGHLVLMEHILNIHSNAIEMQGFDIVLHAGTAVAIFCAYYTLWMQLIGSIFKKKSEYHTLLFQLIVATIPAAVVGVFFGDSIATFLRTPEFLALSFALTGLLLIISKFVHNNQQTTVTSKNVIAMSFMQACAILPGLSRSGSTIAAGMITGLTQVKALDFSFQMALPVILGAFVLTTKDVLTGEATLPGLWICLIGFLVSFITSFLAIYTIRRLAKKLPLSWFALYLFPLAAYCLTIQ